jgi:UDP-N-acetylglucosamine 2-epimerase (non-hydrolysing)
VTCHRRENFGEPMKRIADGLVDLARRKPDLLILIPLHPNPVVRGMLIRKLKGLPNVKLQKPLTYPDFIACLKHAYLVISDSGGVQEEATALGKPVLVLRTETEREEGVTAGSLKLISTDPRRIVRETERLLNDPAAYRKMSQPSKVFGDGRAASRIVNVIEGALVRRRRMRARGLQDTPRPLL